MALYAIVQGTGSTAPSGVKQRFEECRLLERLEWKWDFRQLRSQRAGDVAFLREYLAMMGPRCEERAGG